MLPKHWSKSIIVGIVAIGAGLLWFGSEDAPWPSGLIGAANAVAFLAFRRRTHAFEELTGKSGTLIHATPCDSLCAESVRRTEERVERAAGAAGTIVYERSLSAGRIEVAYGLRQLLGDEPPDVERIHEWWHDRLHPDDAERAGRTVEEAIAGRHDYVVEYRLRNASGQYVEVEDRATLMMNDEGHPVAIVGSVVDVTRRKRIEDELRRVNATLEDRVAERTATLAHRTAQLRLLAAELTDTEQRERRRLAELLHDHLQQLIVAAKMRISLARMRSQEETLWPLLEEVADLLDESLEATRSLNAELRPPVLYEAGLSAALVWLGDGMKTKHGLSVMLDTEESAEPRSDRLKALAYEAVRELLLNVVKHSGADEARVRLTRKGDSDICLSVEDKGRGFDPSVVDRGFSPARGFGLFSIRERLTALGGDLTIASDGRSGTKVQLLFPVDDLSDNSLLRAQAARAVPRSSSRARQGASAGQIAVVLIDDHDIVREGIANLLECESDISVVGQAADGIEGIAVVRAMAPDVVLMDVNMPGLNGIEATRIIHSELPGIRIIGLSVHDDLGTAESMREAGATAYLSKGGEPRSLVEVIRGRATGRSAHAHPAEVRTNGRIANS